MFDRNLLKQLKIWKDSTDRKPLVLRGARQTGKTTLVELLEGDFKNVISLNLEKTRDRQFFQENDSVSDLLRALEISTDTQIEPGKTLLFIDEIQSEPKAIPMLRYFYEEVPKLHVIATGSLLEVALKEKGFSFPVGRVSFLYVNPLRFDEFLSALGKKELRQELETVSLQKKPSASTHRLAKNFLTEYLYVGGMPEAVSVYLKKGGHQDLVRVKEGLLTSFEEDVPKYAAKGQTPNIQFLIQQAPNYAGQRIQYENFGASGCRSREMKQAFQKLEKAMILQRVFGASQTALPLQPNFRVSPKLLYLDVGLIAHRFNVDPTLLKKWDLTDAFRGAFAEQIVGQSLIASDFFKRDVPNFWYRGKAGASSEVDFLISVSGKAVPIEVKSGKAGKLRSLHQFFETASHTLGVRIYDGELNLERIQTSSGKKWDLLSIPFYLVFRLKELIQEKLN